MERIKQALELARQERLKHSGKKSGPRLAGISSSKKGVEDQNIEYTQTRNISISIPELRLKRILVNQKNEVSDAYRILRTQILHRMNEKGWNTLAISSPRESEGSSLTAINLAISLAREVDYTVLLVDANLRSPSISHQLGFHAEFGLSDYLQKDVPLNQILVHPKNISRFVVLPAGHAIENSSEMLSSPKMARLVDELKNRYPSRIVIFDVPPILTSSDALAFSPHSDALLMVVEEGGTQKQDLRQAFEMLQGVEVIGTVLNKAYTSQKDYGDVELKDGILSRIINLVTRKTAK